MDSQTLVKSKGLLASFAGCDAHSNRMALTCRASFLEPIWACLIAEPPKTVSHYSLSEWFFSFFTRGWFFVGLAFRRGIPSITSITWTWGCLLALIS